MRFFICKIPHFKKCTFWRYDRENWVWAKLVLRICPILRIRGNFGYTQLSLTYLYQYWPIQLIYHTSKKIIFLKKTIFF